MEEIRKCHNFAKRKLIEEHVCENDYVLDVGCGCGGDLSKWKHVGIKKLNMCDPDETSIVEARKRAQNLKMTPRFYVGDITDCPPRQYDVICYNFSLQYIFSDEKKFKSSIKCIVNNLKKNGKLIGIIPDSDMMIMKLPYKDELGNFFNRNMSNTGFGNIGEKLWVQLVDTPYYSTGPKSEPIAYKDLLVHELSKHNIELQSWEQLKTGKEISKLYSKFIFVNNK
jgi:SAM-dependent methyltransferase